MQREPCFSSQPQPSPSPRPPQPQPQPCGSWVPWEGAEPHRGDAIPGARWSPPKSEALSKPFPFLGGLLVT